MIIDNDHKYVFVSVPKTGSISIQFSLGHGDYDGIKIPEPELYHQGIKEILSNHPECETYYKFATIRNPWARLVSLYHDFKKRGRQYSLLKLYEELLLSEFKDFNDLCLKLHESDWRTNIFFLPQSDLLNINGKPQMNYLIRFENLASDFEKVCEIIGVKTDLCQMNVGSYDRDYRQYYTSESRKAIEDIYKADIAEYCYEF